MLGNPQVASAVRGRTHSKAREHWGKQIVYKFENLLECPSINDHFPHKITTRHIFLARVSSMVRTNGSRSSGSGYPGRNLIQLPVWKLYSFHLSKEEDLVVFCVTTSNSYATPALCDTWRRASPRSQLGRLLVSPTVSGVAGKGRGRPKWGYVVAVFSLLRAFPT